MRAWRRIDRLEEQRLTERRHLNRQVTTWIDDDGMVVIRGRLTPEAGAVVQRALEAAADRLFKESASAPAHGSAEEVTAGQRRADALALVAECALDRHCQFPGCTARRCDAHHLQPWALGGGTSLDGLLLLCRRHHTAVHEGGLEIGRARDGTVTVVWPGGRRLDSVPPLTVWSDPDPRPLGPTESRLVAAGVSISADARRPLSSHGPVTVSWAIEVLYQPRA